MTKPTASAGGWQHLFSKMISSSGDRKKVMKTAYKPHQLTLLQLSLNFLKSPPPPPPQ